MFKVLVVLCVLGAVFVYAAPAEDKYTDKYDNINVDDILGSKRLLKSYLTCLLDKSPCTPEGSELKRKLPYIITFFPRLFSHIWIGFWGKKASLQFYGRNKTLIFSSSKTTQNEL